MTTATRTKRQPCAACKAKAHKHALDAAYAKYAPAGDEGGFHRWDRVKAYGVLERLDRLSDWHDVDRDIAALQEKASSLSRDWGFSEPSEIVPVVWRDDPLVAGLNMTPYLSKHMHEARSWIEPEMPSAIWLALRSRDGSRFAFDDMWESICHEFLHRVQLEAPEALGLTTLSEQFADREGYCSRSVKTWAPVVANLSLATPQRQRDTLDEMRERCVSAMRSR